MTRVVIAPAPFRQQIDSLKIDPSGSGGDLFGLTVAPKNGGVLFVDDGDNTLKVLGASPASRP
jgi:hypothetical protein